MSIARHLEFLTPRRCTNGARRHCPTHLGQRGAVQDLLARAGLCLVVTVRRAAGGGFLVAMPSSLVPAGTMPVTPADSDVIGANLRLEVPGVRMSDPLSEQIGVDVDVQVADLSSAALVALTPLSHLPESEDQGLIGFGEDLDIIPDPQDLVARVMEWISQQTTQRAAFYSADEGQELPELEDVIPQAVPLPPRQDAVAGITPPEVVQRSNSKLRCQKPKSLLGSSLRTS